MCRACGYAGGGNDQSDTEAEESCDEESADGGNSRDQEADDNALADLDDAVTNDLPHGDLPSSYPKPAVQDRGIALEHHPPVHPG